MSTESVTLMVLLLVAHFIGDFTPLATQKMQEAKLGSQSSTFIAFHAAVHAGLVLGVVSVVRPAWGVVLVAAAFELVTHFVIDFTKMKAGVRYPILRDLSAGPHWYLFGFDQLLHGLVLVAIAANVR